MKTEAVLMPYMLYMWDLRIHRDPSFRELCLPRYLMLKVQIDEIILCKSYQTPYIFGITELTKSVEYRTNFKLIK